MLTTTLRNIIAFAIVLLLLGSCHAGKARDAASEEVPKETYSYNYPVLTAELVLYRDNSTGRCDCGDDCEKPVILTFNDGKLISEEDAPDMDSAAMCSYLKKLNDSQDSLFYIYRRPGCPKYVSVEKASEIMYQEGGRPSVLHKGFIGETMDDILWNDTLFMCNNSPISVFYRYRDVFSDGTDIEIFMLGPKSPDKNYTVIWTLVDGILYLYDIEFNHYEYDMETFQTRFQVVEQLIGAKMQDIPSTDKQGIPATWYNGTLFFKRYAAENESYAMCPYDCEPFYRMDFENGKVISTKRVGYMYY